VDEIAERLKCINLTGVDEFPEDLLAFYHPDTLREIVSLKSYLLGRAGAIHWNRVDDWICLLALNRSPPFVRLLFRLFDAPNQAVSVKSQRKINERRGQIPPRREIANVILKKTRQLLGDVTPSIRQTLKQAAVKSVLLTGPADQSRKFPPTPSARGHVAAVS